MRHIFLILGLYSLSAGEMAQATPATIVVSVQSKTIDAYRRNGQEYTSVGRRSVEARWLNAPILDYDDIQGYVALPFAGEGTLWVIRSSLRLGCSGGQPSVGTAGATTHSNNGNGAGTLVIC